MSFPYGMRNFGVGNYSGDPSLISGALAINMVLPATQMGGTFGLAGSVPVRINGAGDPNAVLLAGSAPIKLSSSGTLGFTMGAFGTTAILIRSQCVVTFGQFWVPQQTPPGNWSDVTIGEV